MNKKRRKKRPEHVEQLYAAAENYIATEGGKLVVIGDVQVIRFPGDPELNFTLGIRCTGRVPKFAEGK